MTGADHAQLLQIRTRMAHDFQGALQDAKILAEQSPASVDALKLLAFLLNFSKDTDGAIEVLERAQNLASGDPDIAFNLGYCRMQQTNFEQATGLFGQAGRCLDDPALAKCLEALCLSWRGERATAYEIVTGVLARQPQTWLPDIWNTYWPVESPRTQRSGGF